MKRIIAGILCYFLGWSIAFRLPGVVLLKWVFNILFAAAAGFGIAILFYQDFAHSAIAETMMAEIAPDTVAEFLFTHFAELKIAVLAAALIALVYLAMNVFLTGGVLHVLHARQRQPWGDFFKACGRHFLPLLTVGVMTAILLALIVGLPHLLFSKLYDIVTDKATTSTISFYYTWVWWFVIFLLASWVLRVYDYARILLFVEPNRNLFASFIRATRFTTRRGLSTFLLWLALVLTPLLFVYGYLQCSAYFGVDTLRGAIIAFALGQLLVILRITAAIARLAGQMRYYQAVAPQPVPFEVDLIADPSEEGAYRMGKP